MGNKNHLISICLLIFIAGLIGCHKIDFRDRPHHDSYPDKAEQKDAAIIFTNAAGHHVFNGGYGSAIAPYPGHSNPDRFYLMTDRGPNIDGFGGKVFPVPDFNPQIGLFKLEGNEFKKISIIHLKSPNGQFITGRPNPLNLGGTGEIGYTFTGAVLPNDPNGLDPEGLVALKDGSFWIADEYGPHLVHFNAAGTQLERISPFDNGSGGRKIPPVFAKRRPNRGMEGLTITTNGKWLVGMMQSPLDNPGTATIRNSRTLRILFFNIQTGATKQYLYQTELPGNLVSEIVAINDNEFYILERDGAFPTPITHVFKKVYRININGATDVSDPTDAGRGKLYEGKSIEELLDNISSVGIVPVAKSLTLDVLDVFPGYPHDKVEGLALVGNWLAISNDDDFAIVDNAAGNYIPKYLPYYMPQQVLDKGVTYFVNLKEYKNH